MLARLRFATPHQTAQCDVLAVAMIMCISIMHLLNGWRIRPGNSGMTVIRSALMICGRPSQAAAVSGRASETFSGKSPGGKIFSEMTR